VAGNEPKAYAAQPAHTELEPKNTIKEDYQLPRRPQRLPFSKIQLDSQAARLK
jgi:hypothetical protein